MIDRKKFVTIYSSLAGLSDTLTGLGLVVLPSLTLGVMGVEVENGQLPLIRFIGAFVFGTGSLYLWAVLISRKTGSWKALHFIWLATAWLRGCVAIVTSFLILSGDLQAAWWSVPITDAALASLQAAVILLGRFPNDE